MRRVLVLILLVVSCKPDTWEGWVYPHGLPSPASEWKTRRGFSSLVSCRAWSQAEASKYGPSSDYECALNCRQDGTMRVCEETVH